MRMDKMIMNLPVKQKRIIEYTGIKFTTLE